VRILDALARVRLLLTAMGPAPVDSGGGAAAPAKAGKGGKREVAESREGSRAMFDDGDDDGGDATDDDDGDDDGDDEPPAAKEGEGKGRRKAQKRDDDDGGDAQDEDDDARGARSEADEDDADDQDGDEQDDDADEGARSEADQDDDDGDDADGDEADEEDPDEAASDPGVLSLRRTWEQTLEQAATSARQDRPVLQGIDRLKLSEKARERFEKAREADKEGANDGEAIFEVAVDAVLQTLGAYHDQIAAPAGERVEKNLRNVSVGRTLSSFRKEMGERLNPAIEKRMAALYLEWADKHGWRAADKVPLADLYRIAGGSTKKPKAKASAKGKRKDDDRRERQDREKREAAGIGRGPRRLGRTSPDGSGKGKPSREDAPLHEFAQDVRGRKPFFMLG
jgi:hypothetical protein